MKTFFFILFLVLIAGCDTVTDRYATLEDARKDKLFDRGWLPNILPSSSRNIRTSNDLDLNTSEGEFSFSPADAEKFTSQLKLVGDTAAKFDNKTYEYFGSESTWIFDCKLTDGFCSYKLKSNRSAYKN